MELLGTGGLGDEFIGYAEAFDDGGVLATCEVFGNGAVESSLESAVFYCKPGLVQRASLYGTVQMSLVILLPTENTALLYSVLMMPETALAQI